MPPVLNSWFKSPFESHSHDTGWVKLGYPKIPPSRTKTYGTRSRIGLYMQYVWNHLPSKLYFSSIEQKQIERDTYYVFLNR